MKLIASKFALACASTAAIIWILSSILFALMPFALMQQIGSHMGSEEWSQIGSGESSNVTTQMNTHMGSVEWEHMMGYGEWSYPSLLIGLILWSVLGGLTGWVIASLYNTLLTPNEE